MSLKMKKTALTLKYKAKKVCAKTALLLLPLLVFLSGCAAFDAPLEGMLSPPKLTKTQTEIYNALTLSIGEQSELIYPKSGEFRSPFVLFNMDGEPTDEAAVFYREKSPDPDTVSGLRMNLLDLMDGQWVSVADRALSGADIERISFYDFGGGINMMISCSFLGQSETALSVMTYSDSRLEELYKTTYSYMDRYDVNDDGFEELFLVHYDPALETNVAYLVGQSKKEEEENRFGLLSSAELVPDMASVQRLTRQKLKESHFLLFIDYSKGDNVYGTQLLSCYSDNLLSINLDKDTSRRYNSNIPMLYSTDIDGDGRVEIPVTSPMLGYEGLTVPEQMLEVDWLVINEESILTASPKYRTYISTGYEYIFYIPVRWQDFVTVQKTENNTVNFTLYDMNTFADVVLSVRAADEPPEEEGWEHYGDSDSKVYIKTPAADAPMALTPDELNSSLYIVPRRSETK